MRHITLSNALKEPDHWINESFVIGTRVYVGYALKITGNVIPVYELPPIETVVPY